MESLVEFIRVWLNDNDRWGAPIVIGGESYGGLRAGGVANSLADIGVAPSGVLLISPAMSYRDVQFDDENYIEFTSVFPSMAAVAHYHGRLKEDLQQLSVDELVKKVNDWRENRFIPLYRQGNRMAPETFDALAQELADFIAIPVEGIKAGRLKIDTDDFSTHLLRDSGRFVGLYDGRTTAYGYSYQGGEDPAHVICGEPYQTAFMRYLTETLGLFSHREYLFLSEEAFRNWDFTLGARELAGYASTVGSLSKAMRRLPYLKVFLAMGRYDMVTPPESAQQSLSKMDIPPDRLAENLESRIYEGGHMMYANPDERKRLSEDVRAWLETLKK